jgi:hypothetical protein
LIRLAYAYERATSTAIPRERFRRCRELLAA